MKIFTVRHGQTDWNLQGRLQGHTDMPLNETGLDQARRIGLRLAGEDIDAIYTSDLSRAVQTAQAINQHHNAEIFTTASLREASFGKYEGRIIKDVFHEINWDHVDPDEEDRVAVFERVHKFLDDIIISKSHKNIVIVGHFGSVMAAICYFLKVPITEREKFKVGNTAIHCFEQNLDGTFRMTIENERKHLD